jgi:hypothetical protein
MLPSTQITNLAGRIIGWGIGVFLAMCAFGFYYAHQAWSTGFFTPSFTTELAVLLYVSVLYLAVNATAKLLIDRNRTLISIELIGACLTGIATLALFIVFPVNFAHVGDVLPSLLRPLLSWVTNDIGRFAYGLAVFGSLVAIVADGIRLVTARN